MLDDGRIFRFTDTSHGYGITRTSRVSRAEYERQEDRRCSSTGEWPTDDPGVAALGTWWRASACVDVDPDVFFVERGGDNTDALLVCSRCRVRHECLDEAIATEGAANQCFGVRGGLSAKARARLWRVYDGKATMTIEELHRLSDEVAENASVRARRRARRERRLLRVTRVPRQHYLDVYLGWVEEARVLRAARLALRDDDSFDDFDPGASPVGAV